MRFLILALMFASQPLFADYAPTYETYAGTFGNLPYFTTKPICQKIEGLGANSSNAEANINFLNLAYDTIGRLAAECAMKRELKDFASELKTIKATLGADVEVLSSECDRYYLNSKTNYSVMSVSNAEAIEDGVTICQRLTLQFVIK